MCVFLWIKVGYKETLVITNITIFFYLSADKDLQSMKKGNSYKTIDYQYYSINTFNKKFVNIEVDAIYEDLFKFLNYLVINMRIKILNKPYLSDVEIIRKIKSIQNKQRNI